MSTWRSRIGGRHGFTLIELMVSVAIILILAALLMPGLAAVRRRARVSQARAEVKALAVAWQRYLSDYRHAPTLIGFEIPILAVKLETDGRPIRDQLVTILYGQNDVKDNNPHRVRYMEDFRNLDEQGQPVTPYWRGGEPTDTLHRYWVKFDMTLDDRIQADPSSTPPDKEIPQIAIVWTYNLDSQPGKDDYIIASWQ